LNTLRSSVSNFAIFSSSDRASSYTGSVQASISGGRSVGTALVAIGWNEPKRSTSAKNAPKL
jgi:hypothetical protein